MDIMSNRTSMSPLIATAILMLFAIGIGIIIMNWATNLETKECSEIRMELISKHGCYRNGTIKVGINILNKGKIDGIFFILKKNGKIFDTLIIKDVEERDYIEIELPETWQKEIEKELRENTKDVSIEVIPILDKPEKIEICKEKSIKIYLIENC